MIVTKIKHRPTFDVSTISQHYSKKDGVPVKYVCSTALSTESWSMDIFYRDTPHPEFGNRYFGLYHNGEQMMITNADKVEGLEFDCIEGPSGWEYSRHRHDYLQVGGCAIDGGRAYTKLVGDISKPIKVFKVKGGEFIQDS